MIEPTNRPEYKFVKYSTHNEAEKGLNQLVAEGWQLVAYQAAGESVITHFLVLSREARQERRLGFN